MNSEAAGLLWHRKNDIESAGGDAAHRQHALKHLKLKTVIKVRPGRCDQHTHRNLMLLHGLTNNFTVGKSLYAHSSTLV